jgi:hypothetical protein
MLAHEALFLPHHMGNTISAKLTKDEIGYES